MKKILGLDLGTNSIGWAVISTDENGKPQKIEGMGSRIIPMDADEMGKFNSGTSISKTKGRTDARGVRRLRERCLLRRERLHRVLNVLGFLPKHYTKQIGWDRNKQKWFGKFLENQEPKLAWQEINEKNQFLFMDSFQEMLADFAENQPDLVSDGKKIPLDWTIYYLRKKALTEKINKEELAWLLLNFNQKRGYYQLRGEEEENNEKIAKTRQYFDKQIVKSLIDTGKIYKGLKVILVELENGSIGKIFKKEIPEWLGLEKNIIATVDIDSNGNDKLDDEGLLSQRFKIPTEAEWETEWKLIKLKTEDDLKHSQKTVGTYIYDTLLHKPNQKIRGKLVRTIEREFYREELEEILKKQTEFHSELNDKKLLEKCIIELYENNENHRNNIVNYSFVDLFIKDIIFYQRPLKSKKSLISDCAFETRFYHGTDKEGKETRIEQPLKCIAKSNPLFQEFRLWKFVANLKIYEREKEIDGKLRMDVDVTSEFLKSEEDYVTLFEWLNDRREIEQNILLGTYFKMKKPKAKDSIFPYRWNYVGDKIYPCNETRNLILNKLEKANISVDFLTKEIEQQLWHILYSVEDKQEIKKALKSFATKFQLGDEFVESFKNCKPFKKEYGSFSEKAIKKLLPLMRMGKYWSEEVFHPKTKERIEKILTGEFDEKIKTRVREKSILLTDILHFKALPEWLASYIVYDRFSEAKDITKWEKVEDLEKYIKAFKQHSLRNPVVEQVILETLRIVRDIWKKEGQIDEIHVELGREMKNDKKERERLTKMVTENENTNLRIKAMLMEFKNAEYQIDGVIPHSPTQQEILRIYEEYALSNLVLVDKPTEEQKKEYEFISKIAKSSQPTKQEITRYKLWLEQKYRSPYTGEMIPLGKLFTTDYEIEHIIPQSRFFDDSFSNKVICEAEVNKLKSNQLGYEFIKNHHGEKVQIGNKIVTIFAVETYEKFVKEHYTNLKGKMKKLLMSDIEDKFIERQLNDTRYISKEIKRLLSNIVREKQENGDCEQEATSKNVISCTGAITSTLKQDWGLNSVWNSLVLSRFERLNELTKTNENESDKFIAFNKEGHKIPTVPFELQKGFTTKRIDHRHHAMDAVIIACATRSHVNYLNNESAKDEKKRYDLKHKLCFKSKTDNKGNYKWIFHKPWETFPQDLKNALDEILISFKKNLRVINKNVNYYEKFLDNGKKERVKQVKGDNWAIRKSMHKDTVFGEVNLRKTKSVSLNEALKNPQAIVVKDLKEKIIELLEKEFDAKKIKKYFEDNKDVWQDIKLDKIAVYYFTKDTKERFFATRKPLDTSFDKEKITKEITDTSIQKILLKHLEQKDNNPELAFSPEGIEEMNRNIKVLNNGKNHQPILKVRWYEKADKFAVGQTGKKKDKFVEAAKGTNLFFAVYQKETYNESEDKTEYSRNYVTIPLNEVIERQKKGLPSAPETNENGDKLLFTLSPNDLVYVPTKDELKSGIDKDKLDKKRIYKMVSSSGNQCFFIVSNVSGIIFDKTEFSALNKMERSITGEMIKEICIPIKVDRLGNIIQINGEQVCKTTTQQIE